MTQFRNILVYAESAEPDCLTRAVELAAEEGVAMTVCDVLEPTPTLPDPDGTLARLRTVAWQLSLERLRRLCAPHNTRIDLDYTVLVGNPFLAITEQVLQQRFDLVVHISDTIAGGGLNPTGMHLIRKCPCAVWSMHPGEAERSGNVLLAVDRDLTSPRSTAEDVAMSLLAAARTVADAGTVVHVVHAWQPFGEALLSDERAGMTPEEAERYVAGLAADYAQWFDNLLALLSAAAPEMKFVAHLERGTVTSVVPEVVRETHAELIIMGTIGTSRVPGVLVGTQAEAILASTTTPILALKPHGFKTPLRFPANGAASDSKQAVGHH